MEQSTIASKLIEAQELGFVPFLDNVVKIKSFDIRRGEVEVIFQDKTEKEIKGKYSIDAAAEMVDSFYIASLPKDMTPVKPTKITTPVKKVVTENDGSSTLYNVQTLRNHLFNQIKELENGTANTDASKAMASCAQAILNSIKLEIQYRQLTNSIEKINNQLF